MILTSSADYRLNQGRPKCHTGLKFTRTKKGEFRFRFKAPNGKNMFASEGYKTKLSAKKTIDSIKKNAADADFDDQSTA